MRKTIGMSLSGKISLIVLIMVVSSTAIVGLFSYYFYRKDSIAAHADKARAIALSVASAIDSGQFEEIIASNTKNQYWYDAKDFVDETINRTNSTYLYVLDKDYDENVSYFMDGTLEGEDDAIDLGEKEGIEVHADELFESISTGLPFTTGIYDAEEYGMLVSGFAPILNEDDAVVGVVGVDINVDDVLEASNFFAMVIIICVAVFSAIFWLISSFYIRHSIGKPIAALSAASGKISKGDMQVELSVDSTDEVGKLTAAFRDMVDSTRTQIAVLERLAEGDLTADITLRSEHDSMGLAMKKTVDNLNNMFGEINNSTEHVSAGADQIANGSQLLAQSVSEQSATMDQLETTIVSVADKTKENTELAAKATDLTNTIKDDAEKGSLQMERMIQAVNEINAASQSIEKVIKTIDDIAFQTNILALNAAVEAARAGQHGKGFAVVADEVRNLASKSALAAKDTNTLIANAIEKAELGTRIADETSESFTSIVSGVKESAQIMGEIVRFSEEQNLAIYKINSDVDQVVRIIHQNSAITEESAASSEELSSQSEILKELVARFRLRHMEDISNRRLVT